MTRLPLAWLAVLAALREQPKQLAEHLTEIDQLPKGGLTVVAADDLVLWACALAADTPVAGLHHLRQISPGPVRRLAAIDRFETAIRADRPDLARDWANELERFGAAGRCRYPRSRRPG